MGSIVRRLRSLLFRSSGTSSIDQEALAAILEAVEANCQFGTPRRKAKLAALLYSDFEGRGVLAYSRLVSIANPSNFEQ